MRDPDRPTVVYGLLDVVDPDRTIRYVGVTVDLVVRLRGWRRAASGQPIDEWIREIGRDRLDAVVLEHTRWADRLTREEHWTKELRTTDEEGGFNQCIGQKRPQRLIEERRLANVELWADQERRAAQSDRLREHPVLSATTSTRLRELWKDPAYRAKHSAINSRAVSERNHQRWHVKRDIVKDECRFCTGEEEKS